MRYHSTNDSGKFVSFREAVQNSLPTDNGLYVPETIPALAPDFLSSLKIKSKAEIGFEIAKSFVGNEIPEDRLYRIVEETVDFDIPLFDVAPGIKSLELFHGPTWAFKDVGARFISRCLGYFMEESDEEVHILVATSGDTGGAVAAGFHGIPSIRVTILFPKGKVSEVQQLQLTTWGDNIQALEVEGTFDDCQRLVKTAFLDKELNKRIRLSSANSINIARLIPQSFYYFYAFQQLADWDKVVFAVPSGNYGNMTAGLLAKRMGLPIHRFIAASNDNRIVPDYLEIGVYSPKPSVQTYANAMDVGAPSNFARMQHLFDSEYSKMTELINGYSLSDPEILSQMSHCLSSNGYLLDPHGAIGFAALKAQLHSDEQGVFLATAHPVKFMDVVEKALGYSTDFQDKILQLTQKSSHYKSISDDYSDFVNSL